jgi:hypothetical protein
MIDTALLKKSPGREPRSSVKTSRDLARYLVAEYLHDWGLRDPDVIAAESRRIVEQAELLMLENVGEAQDQKLAAIAIELTMDEVEAAIVRMATTSMAATLDGVPTNNSIVPRMARVLLEFPEAIRHRDRPPARLLQVLERSVAPIIPYSNHREMRPTMRTRLWRVLRRGYWHQFKRRLNAWTRRVLESSK